MSPMGLSPTSAETQEMASSLGATPTWMDASGTIVMFASTVGLFISLCLLQWFVYFCLLYWLMCLWDLSLSLGFLWGLVCVITMISPSDIMTDDLTIVYLQAAHTTLQMTALPTRIRVCVHKIFRCHEKNVLTPAVTSCRSWQLPHRVSHWSHFCVSYWQLPAVGLDVILFICLSDWTLTVFVCLSCLSGHLLVCLLSACVSAYQSVCQWPCLSRVKSFLASGPFADKQQTCPAPQVPLDASPSAPLLSRYNVDDEVTFQCRFNTDNVTSRCLSDGTWSASGYVCGREFPQLWNFPVTQYENVFALYEPHKFFPTNTTFVDLQFFLN